MPDSADRMSPAQGASGFFERWPTGAKLFLILSAALLPLAVIGVFASIQTTQVANNEVRSRLRVAAAETSRTLAIELTGDARVLRDAISALARDPSDTATCARVQGVFAPQRASGVRFAIRDRAGALLCGASIGVPEAPRAEDQPAVSARILSDGLLLIVRAGPRAPVAAAYFPRAFLAMQARPSGSTTDYAATLFADDGERLELGPLSAGVALQRREERRTDLAVAGLVLQMQVPSAPISSPLVIATLLPLVMWAAAAGIAWFVVDRLLVRPLRRLRASVAAYTPGTVIDARLTGGLPAQELRELGETFRAISRTVVLHEAGLAEGLVRQTKLTREVHHRVKNNLQVIASLISLHARGAPTPEATQAYASIQRRVDALAVVHRNHYAEMEVSNGLELRGMIGELASNLRGNAARGTAPAIRLDVDSFHVTQDTAVAAAFLVTEIIELGMSAEAMPQINVSVKPAEEGRARLRISSPALADGDALRAELARRYGRVLDGLARQLRAKLHHDPLVGAYEIELPVNNVA